MAKRRQARSVILSPGQRERLDDLWFYYGNRGRETTPGNHRFIQHLLEHGLDLRPLFTKSTRKSERPTPECEDVVDAVLKGEGDQTAGPLERREELTSLIRRAKHPRQEDGPTAGGGPRLVESPDAPKPPAPDLELKELLDDMRRRYRVQRERMEREPEAPDAA